MRFENEILQRSATFHLFDGIDTVAFGFQLPTGGFGGVEIAPFYGLIGSQGGLVDFTVGRAGGDTAQKQLSNTKSVGGAEESAHVAQRTDVVEHYNNR